MNIINRPEGFTTCLFPSGCWMWWMHFYNLQHTHLQQSSYFLTFNSLNTVQLMYYFYIFRWLSNMISFARRMWAIVYYHKRRQCANKFVRLPLSKVFYLILRFFICSDIAILRIAYLAIRKSYDISAAKYMQYIHTYPENYILRSKCFRYFKEIFLNLIWDSYLK